MATYQTHQKKDLIDFLKKHSDSAYTIDAIAEEIKKDPEFANPPGKSTIYRLMPKLMDDNLVKCFAKGGASKSSYQIMGGENCHFHIHMKCIGCGKLLHMSDEDSDRLLERIRELNHFDVDLNQTLLFGRCQDCGKGNFEK